MEIDTTNNNNNQTQYTKFFEDCTNPTLEEVRVIFRDHEPMQAWDHEDDNDEVANRSDSGLVYSHDRRRVPTLDYVCLERNIPSAFGEMEEDYLAAQGHYRPDGLYQQHFSMETLDAFFTAGRA